MRNLFLLACIGLFLAGDFVSATTERTMTSTIKAKTINNDIDNELHYVDIDSQSRRKDWDLFGVMLMMIHAECGGPNAEVQLPDCHLLQSCKAGTSTDCTKLCNKRNDHGKSKYKKFCSSSDSSSSSSSENNNYSENSSPESVVTDENMSVGFDFWMVAVAGSVGIALFAIRMGQRTELVQTSFDGEIMQPGSEMRGSVGRRKGAVSDIMDSVLGGDSGGGGRQVEMSGYHLDDPNSAIV